MGKLDREKIKAYIQAAQEVEKKLEDYEELFDREKLYSFQQETKELQKKYDMTQQAARKLNIGIVGAVKAGKSSFLNACIFGGKEFLPKAATPMTAALTRISYSDTQKAIVHFYNEEDWDRIEKLSDQYDKRIEEKYKEYRERLNTERRNTPMRFNSRDERDERDEFERMVQNKMPEAERGAKELTRMATGSTVLEQLGETVELESDVFNKLKEYVGANGRYTPIVSYVELQVNEPWMKDYEIVDTPGLNDPIVSRGIVTKQFLRNCDVAILLSPCSQFMDANTTALMANSLPESGVREIMVVGSKLDSGILNESTKSFKSAYKQAMDAYKKQFSGSLEKAGKTSRNSAIVEKMRKGEVQFISSICYTIAQKRKENIPLNEEEKLVLRNLHQFQDFNDDLRLLLSFAGITFVKKALNKVLERKEEIINQKNGDLLSDAQYRQVQILEQIRTEVTSSRVTLETASAEELRWRRESIRDTIDSTRVKLMNEFDGAVIDCNNRIKRLLPDLGLEKQQHRDMNTNVNKEQQSRTDRVGFLGLKKVVKEYEVTHYSVDTSDVKSNLQNYANTCAKRAQEEFNHLFNEEHFKTKIKNIMLDAFEKSGREIDEEEILQPINNVLKEISVPSIKLDYTVYIDEIDTRFKSGAAKDEQIHELNKIQANLLDRVENEVGKQLMDEASEFTGILKRQAVSFADKIEHGFTSEIEKLETQISDKERYIKEYHIFRILLQDLKGRLQM